MPLSFTHVLGAERTMQILIRRIVKALPYTRNGECVWGAVPRTEGQPGGKDGSDEVSSVARQSRIAERSLFRRQHRRLKPVRP